jgi:hypothetical protein
MWLWWLSKIEDRILSFWDPRFLMDLKKCDIFVRYPKINRTTVLVDLKKNDFLFESLSFKQSIMIHLM